VHRARAERVIDELERREALVGHGAAGHDDRRRRLVEAQRLDLEPGVARLIDTADRDHVVCRRQRAGRELRDPRHARERGGRDHGAADHDLDPHRRRIVHRAVQGRRIRPGPHTPDGSTKIPGCRWSPRGVLSTWNVRVSMRRLPAMSCASAIMVSGPSTARALWVSIIATATLLVGRHRCRYRVDERGDRREVGVVGRDDLDVRVPLSVCTGVT